MPHLCMIHALTQRYSQSRGRVKSVSWLPIQMPKKHLLSDFSPLTFYILHGGPPLTHPKLEKLLLAKLGLSTLPAPLCEILLGLLRTIKTA